MTGRDRETVSGRRTQRIHRETDTNGDRDGQREIETAIIYRSVDDQSASLLLASSGTTATSASSRRRPPLPQQPAAEGGQATPRLRGPRRRRTMLGCRRWRRMMMEAAREGGATLGTRATPYSHGQCARSTTHQATETYGRTQRETCKDTGRDIGRDVEYNCGRSRRL